MCLRVPDWGYTLPREMIQAMFEAPHGVTAFAALEIHLQARAGGSNLRQLLSLMPDYTLQDLLNHSGANGLARAPHVSITRTVDRARDTRIISWSPRVAHPPGGSDPTLPPSASSYDWTEIRDVVVPI